MVLLWERPEEDIEDESADLQESNDGLRLGIREEEGGAAVASECEPLLRSLRIDNSSITFGGVFMSLSAFGGRLLLMRSEIDASDSRRASGMAGCDGFCGGTADEWAAVRPGGGVSEKFAMTGRST